MDPSVNQRSGCCCLTTSSAAVSSGTGGELVRRRSRSVDGPGEDDDDDELEGSWSASMSGGRWLETSRADLRPGDGVSAKGTADARRAASSSCSSSPLLGTRHRPKIPCAVRPLEHSLGRPGRTSAACSAGSRGRHDQDRPDPQPMTTAVRPYASLTRGPLSSGADMDTARHCSSQLSTHARTYCLRLGLRLWSLALQGTRSCLRSRSCYPPTSLCLSPIPTSRAARPPGLPFQRLSISTVVCVRTPTRGMPHVASAMHAVSKTPQSRRTSIRSPRWRAQCQHIEGGVSTGRAT